MWISVVQVDCEWLNYDSLSGTRRRRRRRRFLLQLPDAENRTFCGEHVLSTANFLMSASVCDAEAPSVRRRLRSKYDVLYFLGYGTSRCVHTYIVS